jgi:hypothetical protein
MAELRQPGRRRTQGEDLESCTVFAGRPAVLAYYYAYVCFVVYTATVFINSRSDQNREARESERDLVKKKSRLMITDTQQGMVKGREEFFFL